MTAGELTEEQLRTIFERDIRPELDALGASSHQDRTLLLAVVGGQPGAGKSKSISRIQAQHPGLVEVVGDDLRVYHPDYDRLMRENPLAMPAATAQASGRWVGMAIDYLREQRRSTLIETTLRQPDVVRDTVAGFRQAGYRTELHVVAVPMEVSRLGTISRYVGQVEESGAGRWTPMAAHDVAAAAVPGTVTELVRSGVVDQVSIESRQGQTYYRASPRPGAYESAAKEAAAAIDNARDPLRLSESEARAWIEDARIAVQACVRTGQTDSDLLATVGQVVNRDAVRVSQAAYPADERARQQALDVLRTARRPLARQALGQRIERELKQRRGAGGGHEQPHRDRPDRRGAR
ncbi:hypothetical protein GZ998_08960 [Actinomyces sp. 594]|uniref:zeta toxin family protein n=1 Tax=Actinomyces sp. 594 TaxID=2057793 RepID=UPI001C57035B|nr:zeta toxin family protein [Actinomyces sp. 594]MBW3069629.1 hypothetical protein [Actinomyces sp. 594]